jgi:hypothetical protein
MKCDFRNEEESKKALFKSRLSGEPIHFGFIPVWELKKFVRFCLENKIVEPIDPNQINTWYKADVNFLYQSTYSLTSAWPTAQIMTWLADILRVQFRTGGLRALRTAVQTIDCGPHHTASHYVIRKKMYIS